MNRELVVRNQQRVRRINRRLFRKMIETTLVDFFGVNEYELGVNVVAAAEMTRINETFLQHKGSTDVITFDYSDSSDRKREGDKPVLHGEIFVCVDEAIIQAREFSTSWQSELVRYVVHGILHLRGFDDTRVLARKKMKREEDRVHHQLETNFRFRDLAAAVASRT